MRSKSILSIVAASALATVFSIQDASALRTFEIGADSSVSVQQGNLLDASGNPIEIVDEFGVGTGQYFQTLIIDTVISPSLAGTPFTLDNGGSFMFPFFEIAFPYVDDGQGNLIPQQGLFEHQMYPQAIQATLSFELPKDVNGTGGVVVEGVTFAASLTFETVPGLPTSVWAGRVEWDGPVAVTVPGDPSGDFMVQLTDATFSVGTGGTGFGAIPATVYAVVSVPDAGATSLLLGLGVICMAAVRRNKVA